MNVNQLIRARSMLKGFTNVLELCVILCQPRLISKNMLLGVLINILQEQINGQVGQHIGLLFRPIT